MLPFVDKTILIRLRTFCFSDIIEKNIWKERERCFYKFIKQQGRNWNLGNIADIAVITGVSSGQRFTIYPCISSDIRI